MRGRQGLDDREQEGEKLRGRRKGEASCEFGDEVARSVGRPLRLDMSKEKTKVVSSTPNEVEGEVEWGLTTMPTFCVKAMS